MKKTILSLFAGLLTILVIGGVSLWTYLGGFTTLSIEERQVPTLWMAYLDHTGAYYKIEQTFKKVEEVMKSQGASCDGYVAIYFDDPAQVEESKLRSQGGCLFMVGSNVTFNELKIRNLPVSPAAYTEIPFKMGFSAAVGAIKAYPALKEYMKAKNFTPGDSAIEIYRRSPEKKIEYYFPFKQ